MLDIVDLLRNRVDYVESFPSALVPVARYLEANSDKVPLTAVFTGSETLPHDVRSLFERVFECKVLDLYGQVEKTNILGQCSEGKYHDFLPYGISEIGASPDATTGEIVATSLGNYGFPLIRYATGDVATRSAEACRCGREFPVFDKIEGRLDDVVITPDGRYVWALDQVVRPVPVIDQAQIVQSRLDCLKILYVASRELTDQEREAIQRQLLARVGDSMSCELRRVDAIPRSAGGKQRYVISNISRQLRRGDK